MPWSWSTSASTPRTACSGRTTDVERFRQGRRRAAGPAWRPSIATGIRPIWMPFTGRFAGTTSWGHSGSSRTRATWRSSPAAPRTATCRSCRATARCMPRSPRARQRHKRHYGRRPTAIWLPECAYRPAYWARRATRKPGIEEFVAEEGIGLFFAETHAIEGGTPVGKATDGVVGPYGNIPKRYVVPIPRLRRADPPHHRSALLGERRRGGGDRPQQPHRACRSGRRIGGIPATATIASSTEGRRLGPAVLAGNRSAHGPGAEAALRPSGRPGPRHGTRAALCRRGGGCRGAFHRGRGPLSHHRQQLRYGAVWPLVVRRGRLDQRGAAHPQRQRDRGADHRHRLPDRPPAREVLALPEGSWGAGGTHFTWDNADNTGSGR